MAPIIRQANAGDQRTIRRLVRQARINPLNLRWPNFLVAEDVGAVVGIGQVKTHGDGTREVASIAVVPSRQGQGIGSLIVNSLLERQGDGVLHLACEAKREGFYERFGFRRIFPKDFPPHFAQTMPLVNTLAWLGRTEIIVMRREPPTSG